MTTPPPRAFVASLLEDVAPFVAAEFGHSGPLRFKPGREAVTDVDAEVERRLAARILEHYPDHAVVGEELGRSGSPGSVWEWHLDPLDGTLNYSLGIPLFSTAVVVLEHGCARVGGVMDPLRHDVFTAARGEGAFRGDEPIRVSRRATLREAITSLQSSRRGRFVRQDALRHALRTSLGKVRRLGSVALELAYVAAGRFDLMLLSKAEPPHLHDVAAGLLLVEEAGGRVTDSQGRPFDEGATELVVSNGHVHEEILAILAQHPENGP